ncbi:TFIID and SAGA subunit [Gymnopus androsaceus JB14]|uniref:TFIID and SAGA subunit n=1 Tax=Gymnopus androsaceus JB14 TaxID=1447944 RepID=A0A6A4IFY8_9AGAR|nr:TFIID and SAGA subunit [Gymnopus androsaceus JB14]
MSGTPPSPSDPSPSQPQEPAVNENDVDRLVLQYLRAKGHTGAEKALLDEIDGSSSDSRNSRPQTINAEELVKTLAVFSQNPSRPGENVLKDSSTVLSELSAMGTSSALQALISNISSVGAEEILTEDPSDKPEGFRELVAWVEGSLDMYRPEFRPILFPIFCHFYLDLIQAGRKDAALQFFGTFAPQLEAAHSATLHHLYTLLLPAHVQNDELAQRFRDEKYFIRISRSGFGLLLGWLTEGIGGEAMGAGHGFYGEKGKRGRVAVMQVVNNHLRFDVTSSTSASLPPSTWEESTGLTSSLIPHANGTQSKIYNPQAFNLSKGDLKLGPAPMSEELRTETERVAREKAMLEGIPSTQYDISLARPQILPGMVAPTEADMLPLPPNFKIVDVEREVGAIRDARKRIKLEPSALNNLDPASPQASGVRARALPSICAYTLHDVPEGAPCCTFSQDTSLMAAGFSESYIRLWSLNGEKLRGMRSDFSAGSIRDLDQPLHQNIFSPPLQTIIVAFRGHENPVWDVKWSPLGMYFATASRDRTARLWSTDRTACLRIYAGHLGDVDCVRFHPNSLYLATGSSDWTARLWDVQRGSCVRVFLGHQGSVSTLAISPDGRYLASAGEDLAINLWDIGSGKRIKKMTGHTASIYSLSFSAESSLLLSGGADWTVRCWDVKGAGGVPSKPTSGNNSNPAIHKFGEEGSIESTSDMISTFPTKRTPIINVQFTPRNLCLVGGIYQSPETR